MSAIWFDDGVDSLNPYSSGGGVRCYSEDFTDKVWEILS